MEPYILDGKQPEIEELSDVLLRTQRLAGIGTLAASLAHELTNPLSIITATCHNLRSAASTEGNTTKETHQQIDLIEQSAWRCVHLVQTLRHYSHLDGPDPVECDLNQIIEDSLTLVSYQFEREHSIRIETDLSANMPLIRCDRNQITQVMINLLTNARDALPIRGGMIRIRSWPSTDANGSIFSVSDNGAGVDPAYKDFIFDPFFTTKSRNQGSGLGLAITRQIVEQHRGRITAENNLKRGATFTVFLPA